MKIAMISYEYPPDTADGGIATYVWQAAQMLQTRGHSVEVFAGSNRREGVEAEPSGVAVHRIPLASREAFSQRIAPVFAQRHRQIGFDVLEGPDYGADAADAIRLVPEIPLVVKLHTPRIIFRQLRESDVGPWVTWRERLGALRRGLNPRAIEDLERHHVRQADAIASPSKAIADTLIQLWRLDPRKVHLFPCPYRPQPDLLKIPIQTQTHRVTFIGRVEARKGVLDLAKAIPLILKQCPEAKFRFVGRSGPSPNPRQTMQQYLEHFLLPYRYAVEFTGPVPLDRIPLMLSDTDVNVFPSQWDSFGLVCLEAMSAGRAVIGSTAGGMAEVINTDAVGRLVAPKRPRQIAQAVVELLKNSDLRMQLGTAARERVLQEYSLERVAALQEESYRRAIASKHQSPSY
jgi:glycosyltransferase involved in cell wall biosynthesis